MTAMQTRAKDNLPNVLLTLLSIIQALALDSGNQRFGVAVSDRRCRVPADREYWPPEQLTVGFVGALATLGLLAWQAHGVTRFWRLSMVVQEHPADGPGEG